ncbi:mon2 [Acrasis kona]|uniref:Mon2 n=1 Tax=Acrasis kona TaxID=1008807 RepID=A0AAW2ZF04_9EUKA
MSLIRVLQSELRTLSVEAGRKYPIIKEAADRGIRQLRSIQEKCGEDNASQSKQVRQTEEIAKPFLLACESKNTKLILLKTCFMLHTSKSQNVHHTATATIRQATTLLFEQINKKASTDKTADESDVQTQSPMMSSSANLDLDQQDSRDLFTTAKNAFLLLKDKQCYELLSVINQKIDKDAFPLWDKVLALEVLRILFTNSTQTLLDLNPNLVSNLVSSTHRVVDRLISKDRSLSITNLLESTMDATPFVPTIEEVILLVVDNTSGLAQSLNKQLIEITWVSVLESIALILERIDDDDAVLAMLKIFEGYIKCACETNTVVARDAFLTTLCQFSPQETTANSEIELTRKNVLVMKTLFKIAVTLGGHLGSSWYLLLRSFQTLNTCLNHQSNKSFKLNENNSEDCSILNNHLANLFTSTNQMDLDGLLVLLKSLCSLSQDTIKSNHQHKLFAATKLVEVVQINTDRIDQLWELFSQHAFKIWIENTDQEIRKFGVQAIIETVLAIFRPDHNRFHQEDNNNNNINKSISPEMETKIWNIMASLFMSTFIDVREQLITSLHGLVQKCGQVLNHAWPSILPILKMCSTLDSETKKFIPHAFKCVQIIGNDFLSNLEPHQGLIPYIQVVGCFGSCDAPDINISLVAINIFMSLSDFINAHYTKLDPITMELWLHLFGQLETIMVDQRPEVRHSALRTFTFVLASNGDQLDSSHWQSTLTIVLNVLRNIHNTATMAEKQEVESAAAQDQTFVIKGSNRGKNVSKPMFVHHSRNTQAKQWSETRSLAIESVSRIVKEHAHRWYQMNLKDQELVFDSFIDFILQSNKTHSTEISKTAVVHVQQILLHSYSCEMNGTERIWKGWWNLYSEIIECAKAGTVFVENNLITLMLEGIQELYQENCQIFLTHVDVNWFVGLLVDLMLCSTSMDVIMHPSVIQKSCLAVMDKVKVQNPKIIFNACKNLLPNKNILEDLVAVKSHEMLLPVGLCNKVQDCLVSLVSVDPGMWLDVLQTLGDMCRTRFVVWNQIDADKVGHKKWLTRIKVPLVYPLWYASIQQVQNIMLSQLASNDNNDHHTWDVCMNTITGYLFHGDPEQEDFQGHALPSTTNDDDDESSTNSRLDPDVMVVQLIETVCLPYCASDPKTLSLWVQLLYRSSLTAPRVLAQESLQAMFRLVAKASQQASIDTGKPDVVIGICVMPVLLNRCKEILRSFVRENQRRGKCPQPRYRRAQAQQVMSELKKLDTHEVLYQGMSGYGNGMCGRRGLIVRMFSVLCEFVTCEELEMRESLLEMFRIVSTELQLEDESDADEMNKY